MKPEAAGRSDKLVSSAEIARLAGVTRAAVSNWRRRRPDFPEPVEGAHNALFPLSEVSDWLERQRKSSDISDEVLVWQTLRGRYGDDMISGLADVAEMLAGSSVNQLDDQTRHKIEDLAAQTSPAEVVSALVERLIDSTGSATTLRLTRAVRHFAGDNPGVVLDPACGIGSLLRAFAASPTVQLAGQDLNPSAARLARARALLDGATSLKVKIGDSLRADGWPDLHADVVVCDPPTGVADWGREDLLLDARWEFGIATKAESELAWLQHCYAHVAPGGKVVFVMPPSVAYRKAGRRIRAEIVRRGILTQVVALPPGMVASHAQPVHLWILARPSESEETTSEVRMVDLTGTDPTASIQPTSDQVVSVRRIDLLDEVVDLTPTRHVSATRTDQGAEYAISRDAILKRLSEMAKLLPELSHGSGSLDRPMLRVADLVRAGLVDVANGAVASTSDQLDTDYLRGFLRSASNTSRATSSSGTFRADVRGSQIPQMGIGEQRTYAGAFRDLDDVERQLRELTRLIQDAIAHARDGLTNGALRPDPPTASAVLEP